MAHRQLRAGAAHRGRSDLSLVVVRVCQGIASRNGRPPDGRALQAGRAIPRRVPLNDSRCWGGVSPYPRVVQRRNVFAGRNTRQLSGLDRVGGRGYSALCGVVANGLLSMNEKSTRRRRGWSGRRVSRRMSRHVRATVAVAVLSLAVLGSPVQVRVCQRIRLRRCTLLLMRNAVGSEPGVPRAVATAPRGRRVSYSRSGVHWVNHPP